MTKKYWLNQTPSLLLAAAIILSTLIAALAAKSAWLVLAAPALLAVAVVAADALNSRLHGASSRPSTAALILGASFLLAGLLVTSRDPGLVETIIPLIGAAAWATLLLRPDNRSKTCSAV